MMEENILGAIARSNKTESLNSVIKQSYTCHFVVFTLLWISLRMTAETREPNCGLTRGNFSRRYC
jgi:hypothetical protein